MSNPEMPDDQMPPELGQETYEASCYLAECLTNMAQLGKKEHLIQGEEILYQVLFAPFGVVKAEKIIKAAMLAAGSLDEELEYYDEASRQTYIFRVSNPKPGEICVHLLHVIDDG